MAFETRLTPPDPADTCYWKETTTIALRGDEEIDIPVWLRLNESARCPIHDPQTARPWPVDTCGSPRCRRRIIWAVTEAGKTMPVDELPSEDGNVELFWREGRPEKEPRCRVLRANARGRFGKQLHRAHFATCPDAERFRTKHRK